MVTSVSAREQKTLLGALRLSAFASVKLTVVLLVSIAGCILLGAWCPQEAQSGRDKIIETFGPAMAEQLIKLGIADIFHSPLFLALIGLLTVNMVACSVQRVFPKVRLLRQPMAMLKAEAILKMPTNYERFYAVPPDLVLSTVRARLRSAQWSIETLSSEMQLAGHWGKFGRLAASVTHVGLLMLLAGVTVTSWTGFSGFQPVPLHGDLTFEQSQHSKLWIGRLPAWHVHVDGTRRENYDNGEAKQWYSNLSVVDASGHIVKQQEISVNNPLTYGGVDVYQSSWGLGSIAIAFNGKRTELPLRQMGPRINAAFLPLDRETIMLFSVHSPTEPVRVFAKVPEWPAPRLLAVLNRNQPTRLGGIELTYQELVPITGLQYKCDPGLPLTYTAFGFIIVGVMLAALPFRQVWASVEPGPETGVTRLIIGGTSRKGKAAFAKNLSKLLAAVDHDLVPIAAAADAPVLRTAGASINNEEDAPCLISS
jgi:cytochrome c biogenesis protein